jgi:hypothetical protein
MVIYSAEVSTNSKLTVVTYDDDDDDSNRYILVLL